MKKFIRKVASIFYLFLFSSLVVTAQEEIPFKSELDAFNESDEKSPPAKGQVVFTGSSSIRMWKSLHEDFPQSNIIQRGFGGSQFTDLLRSIDQLIIQYEPTSVFIYEGDNDIGSGKTPGEVLEQAAEVVSIIKEKSPDTKIYFITPKPSLMRESKKCDYLTLNQLLEKLSYNDDQVTVINVWPAMMDDQGNVLDDIFIEDGLHLNEKGYDIWQNVIGAYLK